MVTAQDATPLLRRSRLWSSTSCSRSMARTKRTKRPTTAPALRGGVFDVFHQDNAKVLQSLLKGKKRNEIQRYHAILLEAWRGKSRSARSSASFRTASRNTSLTAC